MFQWDKDILNCCTFRKIVVICVLYDGLELHCHWQFIMADIENNWPINSEKKTVCELINVFATQQFRRFRLLLFPLLLIAKS